ncbi:hypothetical protein GCM10022261_14220 [Brevibacterium daeguense]|uniref:Uncharacterized protein n=1 Tax=Brevibacterium daeguense TaxID=909936 RepID=A0ABP8EJ15_9MICO
MSVRFRSSTAARPTGISCRVTGSTIRNSSSTPNVRIGTSFLSRSAATADAESLRDARNVIIAPPVMRRNDVDELRAGRPCTAIWVQ